MRLRVEPPGAKWESYSGAVVPEAVPISLMLDVTLQRQQKTNGCWAAIAASLAAFYGAAALTQDDIASALGITDDRCARLDAALQVVGCYSHWSPGRPRFERIAHEIAAGRPVGICIDWKSGGSHYVVISGYDLDRRELYVADSLHGPSMQAYDAFPGLYRTTGGIWRDTFWSTPLAS